MQTNQKSRSRVISISKNVPIVRQALIFFILDNLEDAIGDKTELISITVPFQIEAESNYFNDSSAIKILEDNKYYGFLDEKMLGKVHESNEHFKSEIISIQKTMIYDSSVGMARTLSNNV